MQLSKNKKREIILGQSIEKDVFENQDFKRHIQETAKSLNLPENAVEIVIKDFFNQIKKLIYVRTKVNKRVTVFGFFNIEIRKTKSQ